MVHYPLAAVASLASLASLAVALPLNINLGAYSPALVVGDGEISFGGKQDVSSLMNVLEGAAVSAAASVTRTVGSTVAAATGDVSVTAADAASSDPTLQEQAQQISALQGLGKEKEIAPRVQLIDTADATPDEDTSVAKRDLASFDRALKYAEAALQKGPKVQLGTGVEGSGVGIIVDNNQEAAARKGKGVAKRDSEGVSSALAPKRVRAKVTTIPSAE